MYSSKMFYVYISLCRHAPTTLYIKKDASIYINIPLRTSLLGWFFFFFQSIDYRDLVHLCKITLCSTVWVYHNFNSSTLRE